MSGGRPFRNQTNPRIGRTIENPTNRRTTRSRTYSTDAPHRACRRARGRQDPGSTRFVNWRRDRHQEQTPSRARKTTSPPIARTVRRSTRTRSQEAAERAQQHGEEHEVESRRAVCDDKIGVAVDEREDGLAHAVRPDRREMDGSIRYGSSVTRAWPRRASSYRRRARENRRSRSPTPAATRTSRADSRGGHPWSCAEQRLDHRIAPMRKLDDDLALQAAQPRYDLAQRDVPRDREVVDEREAQHEVRSAAVEQRSTLRVPPSETR